MQAPKCHPALCVMSALEHSLSSDGENTHWSLIAPLLERYPGLIPGSGRSAGEGIGYPLQYSWASLMAQLVNNLSAMRETWV